MGTDEDAMIEILCSRTNAQIKKMAETYKTSMHLLLYRNILFLNKCSNQGNNIRQVGIWYYGRNIAL